MKTARKRTPLSLTLPFRFQIRPLTCPHSGKLKKLKITTVYKYYYFDLQSVKQYFDVPLKVSKVSRN